MTKVMTALFQLMSGACDKANKYTGISSNEKCSLRCLKASIHSCLLLAIGFCFSIKYCLQVVKLTFF
jgi:hypothetical protein